MKFNKSNLPKIRNACENKEEIEFEAPKDITPFKNKSVPSQWKAFPPTVLPPEGYGKVLAYSSLSNTNDGVLTFLELIVHVDGGQTLYREHGPNEVSVKFTWPQD